MILFKFAVQDIFDMTIKEKIQTCTHISITYIINNGHIEIFRIHKMDHIRYAISGTVIHF